MAFSDAERLRLAEKLFYQITGTANASPGEQFWYNEALVWAPIVPPSRVWADFASIPAASTPTDADNAVTANPTILEKRKLRLTLRLESNDRAYLARSIVGDNTSPVLENGVQPQLIRNSGGPSSGYIARLYHGDPDSGGVEITTTQHGGGDGSPAWAFSYASGVLLISTDQRSTFRTYYDTNGLWLVWYRYIGPSGGSSSGPQYVSFTNQFQIDVTHSLGRRPMVQVLEQVVGGIFGTDEGFGVGPFGSSDVFREIEPVHVEIQHLSSNLFRVLLDNYYTGEILYL